MPPESPKAPDNVIAQQPTLETSTPPSQHGQCRDPDQPLPVRPHDRGTHGGSASPDDAPDARLNGVDGANGATTPPPPPRNRIDEYEKALVKSARKADGPLFEVVKSHRKPDDKSSPITGMPNEILIHAIAHLSPNDLAAVALVSRRFNHLVTTPHAWQVAFARYFPGPQALEDAAVYTAAEEAGDVVRSEKRRFTRLTALASWRSEYIMRTRMLRSLARGKPVQLSLPSARPGQVVSVPPVIMYNAYTYTTINHIHASFGTGLNKREPRFVHGADDVGMVTASDPTTGKVDPWGQSDPNFYSQFSERFPGTAEWGLGSGEVVGRPNVMDVSQPHGMIYGQGCPEGSCYFRSPEEMRGRAVAEPSDFSKPEAGIPKLGVDGGAICSVWLAKSNTIPSLSDGMIGMMTGSAAGVVSACSLGTDGLRASRLQRGELTARWVLSPGVPIVSIVVDEHYSQKRQAQNRIWAVALNALGELFYLTKFPTRSQAPKGDIEEYTEYLAWLSGRSVYWNLVEPSRRTARPDPYSDAEIDGSYSPRTSWDGMCLSQQQQVAETREIQQYIRKPPKEFRKACLGWDMRRRLEVDFAGDDGNMAGEAMLVFECGLEEGETAEITRFTRWTTSEKEKSTATSTRAATPQIPQSSSLFGGSGTGTPDVVKVPLRNRSSSYMSGASSPERANMVEEWRTSKLTLGGFRNTQLTVTTLDISTFATLTMSEDPALGFSTDSTASSPYASPMSIASQPASPADIPGQRARFVAAGTKSGVVLLWDIRAPVSRSCEYANNISPVRIVYTESPEISCIALTSLHLVIGGNDGLVQTWDPLASTPSPIRTLNSRFSSRARRRLAQAAASVQGVGINMFAAGAVCLDPDPTVLRGAVALGSQVRYWSYSSSADPFKSSKRRLRRAERGSNPAGERFVGPSRGNLKGYIENEQFELERDKLERKKQAERLAGRFGTELLGDEDEAFAYAAILSQESLEAEEKKRLDAIRRQNSDTPRSATATPTCEPSFNSTPAVPNGVDADLDADIAEAIRLSLSVSGPASAADPPQPHASDETHDPFTAYADFNHDPTPPSAWDVPIKYAKSKKPPFANPGQSSSSTAKRSNSINNNNSANAATAASSHDPNELDDLEFAMQLSLAEEASRREAQAEMDTSVETAQGGQGGEDEFPALRTEGARGKGKGRMW
jgi:hypothetical protein